MGDIKQDEHEDDLKYGTSYYKKKRKPVKTITAADIASVNRSITPKIEQNRQERIQSMTAGKDIFIG